MEQFTAYEEDFKRRTEAVKRQLRLAATSNGERRKAAADEAERSLEEATNVVRKMEALARETPQQRMQLTSRAKIADGEVARLRRELLAGVPAPGVNVGDQYAAAEGEQRDKLLDGFERDKKTTSRLANAQRIGADTESVGVGILADLDSQGNQLRSIRDRLGSVNDKITVAKSILISMGRRIAANKVILGVIIAIQLITVFLIIFFKWIYPHIPKGGGGRSEGVGDI